MAHTMREVMTAQPRTVPATATVLEAAHVMRDHDVGAIAVISEDRRLQGLVTDRDIVVRAVARGLEPASTPVREICSSDELAYVTPTTPVDDAVRRLLDRAVRRLPVVEDGRLVGIVSIGDLAVALDPGSALASLSRAEANR